MVNPPEKSSPGTATYISYAVAIVVLGAFGFFTKEMLDIAKSSTADDLQWARLSQIYNGIEALAFAAAGLLFGTVIQGKRAKDAEDRADSAKEEATEATIKGKTLAEKVLALGDDIMESETESATPEARSAMSKLDDAMDLARKFYP